ncbi:MAG: hypothetical protein KAU23_02125 [Anaerolineales bacterium]|nr:hypothetical protein [Anaerolineales bacterium]
MYFREDRCTLHSLDGWREAPGRVRMVMRGADGVALFLRPRHLVNIRNSIPEHVLLGIKTGIVS